MTAIKSFFFRRGRRRSFSILDECNASRDQRVPVRSSRSALRIVARSRPRYTASRALELGITGVRVLRRVRALGREANTVERDGRIPDACGPVARSYNA